VRWHPAPASGIGLALALLFTWSSAVAGPVGAQAAPDLGWLGISISDVSEDLADRLAGAFGPEAGTGVVVVDVLKGGPAEASPLKRGDVIVRVDRQPIWDVRQLQRTIRATPVNTRVTLTVLRESSRIAVPVKIGAMPLEARAQLAGERFGFFVRAGEQREERQAVPESPGRIVVAFVDSDSAAWRAGLRPQDVILKVNGQPIGSLEDFDRAMPRTDAAVSLLVNRRGADAPLALGLELPAR